MHCFLLLFFFDENMKTAFALYICYFFMKNPDIFFCATKATNNFS